MGSSHHGMGASPSMQLWRSHLDDLILVVASRPSIDGTLFVYLPTCLVQWILDIIQDLAGRLGFPWNGQESHRQTSCRNPIKRRHCFLKPLGKKAHELTSQGDTLCPLQVLTITKTLKITSSMGEGISWGARKSVYKSYFGARDLTGHPMRCPHNLLVALDPPVCVWSVRESITKSLCVGMLAASKPLQALLADLGHF